MGDNTAEEIRIGISGMGVRGTQYAELLLRKKGAVKLAAVTRGGVENTRLKEKISDAGCQIFHDEKELLEKGNVDAMIVAAPHYSHEKQVITALKKGIHVLCEKPAAVDIVQAENMQRAARQSSAVYAVAFQYRMHPIYEEMKHIVESAEYGKLVRLSWTLTDWYRENEYYRLSPWRGTWEGEGGGVLLNQCSHYLDLLQWIVGMPTAVRAFCHEGKFHDIKTEDEAFAYMQFHGGAAGVLTASTGEKMGVNRLEFIFETARIVIENHTMSIMERGHKIKQRTWKEYDLDELMLSEFIKAISEGKSKCVMGGEAINSLMISNAMYLSSWRECVIQLPIGGQTFRTELQRRKTVDIKRERDA